MLRSIIILTSMMLVLSAFVGMIINRRNLIVMLLCVEMIFLSANINFVYFSQYHQHVHGQVMALMIIVVAAAESAVALALMVLMYRQYHSVDSGKLVNIRG